MNEYGKTAAFNHSCAPNALSLSASPAEKHLCKGISKRPPTILPTSYAQALLPRTREGL